MFWSWIKDYRVNFQVKQFIVMRLIEFKFVIWISWYGRRTRIENENKRFRGKNLENFVTSTKTNQQDKKNSK